MTDPSDQVLATVVTYNPDDALGIHLAALRSQIARVVVVDNGSRNVADVRAAAASTGCEVIANAVNRGIAAALNQGRELALSAGVPWLATFDQDSLLPPHAISTLLAQLASHPSPDRVGVLAPAHCDRATHADYHHPLDILEETPQWRLLRSTITSGSLIRREALVQLGGFEERLFIDSVDHEFCLRLRRHGWLVAEDRRVVMPHSIGASTEHRLLGVRLVCTHHAPVRRYYITRNLLEVCFRYALVDPVWCGKGLLQWIAGSMAVLLFEQQKAEKVGAMAQGVRDFILRRFGARR